MMQFYHQRRYGIIGTGAIGGYYGACLRKAGFEVHFLAHSDYEHISQHGLTIDSFEGDFRLPQVDVYANAYDMPPCDVIVVALKTTQNFLLKKILPPLLKQGTTILMLQNGLSVEEDLAEMLGNDYRIIGGLCFICSNKVGAGHIQHLDYKAIALGEYAPKYVPVGISEELEAIAKDFESAQVPIIRSHDLLLARWEKLLWNIPFNGLSVVLNATTDRMISQPNARQLAEELMNEARVIAAAYGRKIDDAFVEKMLKNTEMMKPYRTSMKIDYDLMRPLEIDAIIGKPLKAAKEKGINTPKLEMLFQQLNYLNQENTVNQEDFK